MRTDKKVRKATHKVKRQRERAKFTGYEVEASLLFRIVFHLAG